MASPQLILIEGFIGAGKSTLSGKLSRRLSLPRIDVDLIMNRLLRSNAWQPPGYQPSAETFDVAAALTSDFLSTGCGVILEAGQFDPWLWPPLELLRAEAIEFQVVSFQLHAPLEICADRAQTRVDDGDRFMLDREATLALRERWNRQEAYTRDGMHHLHTTEAVEATLESMLETIRRESATG